MYGVRIRFMAVIHEKEKKNTKNVIQMHDLLAECSCATARAITINELLI